MAYDLDLYDDDLDLDIGGYDEDDIDDLLTYGGPEDFGFDDYVDAYGGPVEYGGIGKWLRRAKKKLMMKLHPGYRRRMKKKKKKKKYLRAAALLASRGTTTTVTNRKAPTRKAGARYINNKRCSVVVSPIPIEARVPVDPAAQALLQGPLQEPHAPVVASVAFTGGTAYATLDPWTTFNFLGLEGPPTHESMADLLLKYFAFKVDIGLPGVNAAAGIPLAFDVYTTSWYVDPFSPGSPPPGSPFTCTPGPAPEEPVPDDLNQMGTFASGQFIITPDKINEASSLMCCGWKVRQGIPQPNIMEYGIKQGQNIPGMCYPDPKTSAQYLVRGLTLRITSAPINTNGAITLLTPTHPDWQSLYGLVQG